MRLDEEILAESLVIASYFKMEVTITKNIQINSGFQGISSMQEILYWERLTN